MGVIVGCSLSAWVVFKFMNLEDILVSFGEAECLVVAGDSNIGIALFVLAVQTLRRLAIYFSFSLSPKVPLVCRFSFL